MPRILKTNVDFDNAMYFGHRIEVWQDGKIIDYGGCIEKATDQAVLINGGWYLKKLCEFHRK